MTLNNLSGILRSSLNLFVPTMLAEYIFSSFKELLKLHKDEASRAGDDIPIPSFSEDLLIDFIIESKPKFTSKQPLLRAEGEHIIVGDLHGNLHDLIRIFSYHGMPPYYKYIFLGDYVDRWCYSLEVIILLIAIYCRYPDCIILLRGNHEFASINKTYGFHDQIYQRYGSDELWVKFNDLFQYFPLACILDEKYFLVHAGIESTEVTLIESIENLSFPITDCNSSLVANLMWSDPTLTPKANGTPNLRGVGEVYSRSTLSFFLQVNKLEAVIRGHECVNGIKVMWDRQLVTVFSSSGYKGQNIASALVYTYSGFKQTMFDPISYPLSRDAFFFENSRKEEVLEKPKLFSKQFQIFFLKLLFLFVVMLAA